MKFTFASAEKKSTYCSGVQEDGAIYLVVLSEFNDNSVYVRFIKRTPVRDEIKYAKPYSCLDDAYELNIYLRMALGE